MGHRLLRRECLAEFCRLGAQYDPCSGPLQRGRGRHYDANRPRISERRTGQYQLRLQREHPVFRFWWSWSGPKERSSCPMPFCLLAMTATHCSRCTTPSDNAQTSTFQDRSTPSSADFCASISAGKLLAPAGDEIIAQVLESRLWPAPRLAAHSERIRDSSASRECLVYACFNSAINPGMNLASARAR